MATLNGLRLKGVKVELGIPEDLWNATSAETSKLKRQCDKVHTEMLIAIMNLTDLQWGKRRDRNKWHKIKM